jgi:phage tail sheath gpL-like
MALSTAVDPSAIARVVGIETKFRDLRSEQIALLPQRIAIIGQGATPNTYPLTPLQITSAEEAGDVYGYGTPLHIAAQRMFPVNGDGVGTIPVTIYPVVDPLGGAVNTGNIVPVGGPATKAGTFVLRIGSKTSLAFRVEIGDVIADVTLKITNAINGVIDMPVVAADVSTQVDLTTKWQGASANQVEVNEIVGPTDTGFTFNLVNDSVGAGDIDPQPALDLFADSWETMVLNCDLPSNSTALDAYESFGEGRWGALVRKPLVVVTGFSEDVIANITAITSTRNVDRTNVIISAPDSESFSFEIGARVVAIAARQANSNPPVDYGSQPLAGILPGADEKQWTYSQRDLLVKDGASTTVLRDNVVEISDLVTTYHPTGQPVPAYRYVVDIVKLQNILYNLDLIFNNADWDGAPLLPDGQPTSNRAARKPKMAVAAVAAMIDSLALAAFISDPETAKENTSAEIDSGNPKRLNVTTQVQLSGNTNIIAVDLNFGFFFGTNQVVA